MRERGQPLDVAPAAAKTAAGRPRLWRGFGLGLLLTPPTVLWVLYTEAIGNQGPRNTMISLSLNVLLVLCLLSLLNLLLRRVRPSWTLTHAELVIVYIVLAIGTSLGSLDMMQARSGGAGRLSSGHLNRTDQGASPLK